MVAEYHDHEDDVTNACTKESKGREMAKIPLCIYCYRDTALEKAFDLYPESKATTGSQTQLGGDSSMDIPPSSPVSALDEEAKSIGVIDSILPGETIAKLHIRRWRQDPRFAELEGVVPLDSAVQISITDSDHPFPFHNTHTHTHTSTPQHPPPYPARRPLPWLRSRNQAGEEGKTEQERPASVLDAHFLSPCCIKRTGTGWSHIGDEILTDYEPEADIVLGVNVHVHRLTSSDFRVPAKGLEFSPEPVADIERPALEEEFRLPPPPLERVPDEASLAEEENNDSSTTDTLDANANTKAGPPNHDTEKKSSEGGKGKGKSVVWDATVARGETESDSPSNNTNLESESERSHESELDDAEDYYYPPPPSSKPLPPPPQQGDPRKKRGSLLTSPPPPPTPTQQSEEYLESYTTAADKKKDETRLASLAMPGRWRGRRIGRGRGRKGVVCPRCGHRE
ncbi:hypothetical protein F4679DRAFT_597027 [Xylaria curta]|nr:hypothetical protein F4679DRAFT_597027 [Xylaria curta]